MKTRNAPQLYLVWMFFSLVFGFFQNAPATSPSDSELSGRDIKIENAVSKSDSIFVGKISKMRLGSITATDRVAYGGVQIRVLQFLRGSIDSQSLVTIYITASHVVHEAPPEVGMPYIFFVTKNTHGTSDPYTVLKLLPATDDNIAKVKQLIATATK